MEVEYLPSFIRDLKKLKKTNSYEAIKYVVFEEIPNCKNITEINNLKKIRGASDAYRIRVGNYRIGIFIKNELVSFSRVLHRKEVYRYFP